MFQSHNYCRKYRLWLGGILFWDTVYDSNFCPPCEERPKNSKDRSYSSSGQVSLLRRTSAQARKVKSDCTMSRSSPLVHWSRRLKSAESVMQMKYRARLWTRSNTTSLAWTWKRLKAALKSSSSCCIWPSEPVGSNARDWNTIVSSHWTTLPTDNSSSSASRPTTTTTADSNNQHDAYKRQVKTHTKPKIVTVTFGHKPT